MEQKLLRILLLEDNADDRVLIKRVLRKGGLNFESVCVDARTEFQHALDEFCPDVILSDHGLPAFNSREALDMCLGAGLSIPFILVTGSVSEEYAISSLQHGADDYILKTNLSRLPLAIRSALKRRKLEKLKREDRHLFRAQNKELSKVNEELDNFVYNVSHNLRGPLASLMGLLNITSEMESSLEIKSIHAKMSSSIIRLEDTLEEIVDYSKNARNELVMEEINWKELIANSYSKLEYLNPVKKFMKITVLETDVPFFSDYTRLSILFNSILSNAIRYQQEDREGIISVNVVSLEASVTIKIRDNGIGIEPAIMPRIYEMFYRGTGQSQGAGLGLYIVKEVLQKLKGTINIETVVGAQTTVTLVIPNSGIPLLQAA